MRLPREMQAPGALFGPWMAPLVGVGVLLLVPLAFAPVPLDATHDPVAWRDGPRARFLGVSRSTFEPWVFIDSEGTIRTAHAVVVAEDLDAVVRSRRKVAVRSHRSAPWRALRALLSASTRAGHESLDLEVVSRGGHRTHLSVVSRDVQDGDEVIPIVAVPPREPDAVRRQADERAPILRFDPPARTSVQDVVSTWECYGDSLVVLAPLR